MQIIGGAFRVRPLLNWTFALQVMNLLIQELDWTYMAIIYDNDSYGINGVSELLSNVKSKDICFPRKIAIDPFMAQADLLTILKLHLEDLLIHSNIGGILVFGSLKLGTAILKATDIFLEGNPNYTSPVFLFSESSSYFDDQFTNVSRGAFAVSPPRRYVQEFLDYWTTIFTDVDTLYVTIASNKYIKLLYEKTFSCELAEAKEHHNCTLPSRGAVLNKLKPSLYNQYAVQAAMTITKAVKEVHYKECETKLFHCTELFNVPRQRFIDIINKLVVKFDDDFSLRLKTFKNPDLQISFNGETDITLPPDYPEYEVYNHQMCAAEERFCFKKVI